MKDSKKLIIGAIIIIVFIVVAFFVIKKKKAEKEAKNQMQADEDSALMSERQAAAGNSPGTNKADAMTGRTSQKAGARQSTQKDSFPLAKGDTGKNVEILQKFLNTKFNAGLEIDGDFGGDTETALKKHTGLIVVNSWGELYSKTFFTGLNKK